MPIISERQTAGKSPQDRSSEARVCAGDVRSGGARGSESEILPLPLSTNFSDHQSWVKPSNAPPDKACAQLGAAAPPPPINNSIFMIFSVHPSQKHLEKDSGEPSRPELLLVGASGDGPASHSVSGAVLPRGSEPARGRGTPREPPCASLGMYYPTAHNYSRAATTKRRGDGRYKLLVTPARIMRVAFHLFPSTRRRKCLLSSPA